MDIAYHRMLIFDGSHALHRNLAVPNNWDMRNSKGQRTGGIYGVLRTIQKELKTYNYFPVVVFDGSLSERRLKLHPNYKHTQDKKYLFECKENLTEDEQMELEFRREYVTERNILINLLPLLGIPVIYHDKWEGDDLIYILTKLCHNSVVVSDDKDLLQLIHDPIKEDMRLCRIRRAMRDEFWDMKTIKENNMDIQEFICCKAIVGDPSDNIPSACFQVGEKTAPGLYKLYMNCIKDNIEFPQDEKQLTEVCKKYDLAKRKAYLNFDKNQFNTNYLLTDLSLVDQEINEELIKGIVNSINLQRENSNLEEVYKYFDEFEIKTIDPKDVIDNVSRLKVFLDLDKLEETNSIIDVIEVKQGLF